MTQWKANPPRSARTCNNRTCLNVARPGDIYCKPCRETKERGEDFLEYCKVCMHPLRDGHCKNCAMRAVKELERLKATPPDPRIAKLERVIADPASTPAEIETARRLIERVKAKP